MNNCCCKANIKLNTEPMQPIRIDTDTGSPFLNMNSKDTGPMGPQGPTGNGIEKIEKTSTSGLVDTYTITYTNGDTTTFEVKNGEVGPEGPEGPEGKQGADGKDATINGENVVTLKTSYGISFTQSGGLINISGKEITDVVDGISAVIPAGASEQNQLVLSGSLQSEVTNRQNADNNLQSQIDAISASSDVTDIVGTYAELQSYDTSKLKDNDIVKVLQDESQNGETTYYRWNIHTETFSLIGEEGPYYTKGDADSTFVPQTRTVNGKALSNNISLNATDVGAATSAQGAKADTALQPSALNGYATEVWVGQQGYITSAGIFYYGE